MDVKRRDRTSGKGWEGNGEGNGKEGKKEGNGIQGCARLAQLVRSLTANKKNPGSIAGLVEG